VAGVALMKAREGTKGTGRAATLETMGALLAGHKLTHYEERIIWAYLWRRH